MNSGFYKVPNLPQDTCLASRKIFNIQHVYLQIGDHIDTLLEQVNLSALAVSSDTSMDAAFWLVLVTAFQYAESLPDSAAREAVLNRMDWKYALRLPLKYCGIAPTALCELRKSMHSHPAGAKELSVVLQQLRGLGLFSRSKHESFNAGTVLSTICRLTILDRLNRAMQSALAGLASTAPDWLRGQPLSHWYEQYTNRKMISMEPLAASRVGADIKWLMDHLAEPGAPDVSSVVEVQDLICLWNVHFSQGAQQTNRRAKACAECLMMAALTDTE